jgi:outer membrane protein insertion porin family
LRNLIYRHLSLIIISILLLLPNIARSADSIKVMVLPFDIHSSEDLSSLQSEILKVLQTHIREEGAVTLASGIDSKALQELSQNYESIRKFGETKGVDYVVWGSLSLIGKKFSLDVKMLNVYKEGLPLIFVKEGQGIENLPGIVKQLSRDIGMKLFKREKIVSVEIAGNKRIESDAIKRVIKTKPGDIYLSRSLSEDLKAVYAMGYFDDIRIEAENTPEGKKIIFRVK